jgi:hypothetical protein
LIIVSLSLSIAAVILQFFRSSNSDINDLGSVGLLAGIITAWCFSLRLADQRLHSMVLFHQDPPLH